ncbi:siderophore-interacting protein [Gordonia malaquae]|uniref:siderophore-interacting protein n=1 Tax=Gordonia malaquae TaxID=410332 RepID=UPI0030FF1B65
MAQLRITPLPIILRRLTVLDVGDVTDRMRRVTLGGPELGCFDRDGLSLPAFTSEAFDDHVKLIFTAEGDIADALPAQRELGIEWGASEHRLTRDYTPVHVDVEGGSMAFDFVVHSDGKDRGPAETWACAAAPGDELWIVGPKSSTVVPADAEWALLAGDETAQPAVERFLLDRPIAGPARIVLTIADDSARRELPLGPDDTITWVVAAPGDRDALVAAVRAVTPPPGVAYVWAAAESRSLLAVRKYVARELAVPKDHVDITGYWHRREPEALPSSDESAVAVNRLELVESPVTWFAVRAALRLGLLELVDAHHPHRAALAAHLVLPEGRIDPLVEVLLACGVFAEDNGRLVLGEVGDTLLTDPHEAEVFDGAEADKILALKDLAEALPTGRSAWETTTGQTFAAHVQSSSADFAELIDESSGRVFLMPAVAALTAFADQKTIAFCGPGAAVVADGLQAAGRVDGARTTIIGTSAEVDALRASSTGDHEYSDCPLVDGPPVDLLVGVDALSHLNDQEAVTLLRSASGRASSVLLIESTSADALGTGELEEALIHLAAVGESPRNVDRLSTVAEAAGWRIADTVALGWGVDAVTLTATT